jgi:predicted AAA+ superfamily ATPase
MSPRGTEMLIQRKRLLDALVRYRHKDLVKIITGVRRSGKSVLLNELFYHYLIDDGQDTVFKSETWVSPADGFRFLAV